MFVTRERIYAHPVWFFLRPRERWDNNIQMDVKKL
jgi:hypothetical protein